MGERGRVLRVWDNGLANEALPLLERLRRLSRADEERAGAEGGDDAELACLVGDEPDPARREHAERRGAEGGLEVRERAVVVEDAPEELVVPIVVVFVLPELAFVRGRIYRWRFL